MRRTIHVVLILSLVCASGCATATNVKHANCKPFGGTKMNCVEFCGGGQNGAFAVGLFWPLWLADKPLSFAGDVVTLPYVLWHREEMRKHPAPKEESRPDRQSFAFRGHKSAVYSAAFSADGRRVLTCGADDAARLWDPTADFELNAFRHPAAKPGPFGNAGPALARLSPDGRRVLTVTANNYDHGPDAWPGCQSASAGEEQRVNESARLWDAETGKVIAEWTPDHPEKMVHGVTPFGAAFSPDSRLVATPFGSELDRTVHVRETTTGKERFRLAGHEHPVVDVAFSPDSKLIATASLDRTARIWDAATGKCVQTLKGHTSGVTGVTFSPDGLRLLTQCAGYTHRFEITPNGTSGGGSGVTDAIARVWDVKTGEQVQELTWGGSARRGITLGLLGVHVGTGIGDKLGFVRTASFSPDGKGILTAGTVGSSSGGDERHPTVWTVADGKRGVAFKGETFRDVLAAAFSPDGKYVATAGKDGVIRVWDAATGKERLTLRGHTKLVRAVAFSPDGNRLLTASDDGTAGVWDVSKP